MLIPILHNKGTGGVVPARAVDYVEVVLEDQAWAFDSPSRIGLHRALLPVRSATLVPQQFGYDMEQYARQLISALPSVIVAYSCSGRLATRLYPDDAPYLFAAAGFGWERIYGTDPDGRVIPDDVACWRFTRSRERVVQTMQMRLGYQAEGVYLKGQGLGVESLSIDQEGELAAYMRGLYLSVDGETTTSEAALAASTVPFRRGGMTVAWGASAAAVEEFSLSLDTPLKARSTPGLAGAWAAPTVLEHAPSRGTSGGSLSLRDLSADEVDMFLAGSTFEVRATWDSANQSTDDPSYTHRMWAELPSAQYAGLTPDGLTARRRRGAQADFVARYDTGALAEATVTIACGRTSFV